MKNYNYGWAILRMWMCFEVVTDHLWYRENGISNIGSWLVYLHGSVAVPVFMLLAFVLSYDKIQSDSKEKYVERLQRYYYHI